MSALFLSKATLRRDANTNALAALLDPADGSATLDAHHRLLWSLFADSEERLRDFLWRSDSGGRFMLLSHRQPVNRHELFDVDTREFEPVLATGDRLRFSLRVNAVVSKWRDSTAGKKQVRHDIVMDALHMAEKGASETRIDRTHRRDEQTQQAARRWMTEQGKRRGFKPEHVLTQAYRTLRVPRRGSSDARFGILDLEGLIVVEDSQLLLASMAQGFGKAKAFGNGLMLIKRA